MMLLKQRKIKLLEELRNLRGVRRCAARGGGEGRPGVDRRPGSGRARKRPFEWQWGNPASSGGRRDFVSRLFD